MANREVAYKLSIGQLLSGEKSMEGNRLNFISFTDKRIIRANIIAAVVEKYVRDEPGQTKYASLTLDDNSGQMRLKIFGDLRMVQNVEIGNIISVIGFVRFFADEVYILPEILRKVDEKWLMVRKIETAENKNRSFHADAREKIIEKIKEFDKGDGAEMESLIMAVKIPVEQIHSSVQKLLEEGTIYEPKPGRIRLL